MNEMNDTREPITLELAPLAREKIGPFILLGLEKDAGPEEIEAHWAERVIRARKNQIAVPLTDVNWAREVLNDPDKRVRADAASLNIDITAGVLQDLAHRYHVGPGGPGWNPLEMIRPPAKDGPSVDIPDPEEIRKTISIPEPPDDLPGVRWVLDQFLEEPIDPWSLQLPGSEKIVESATNNDS